MPIIIRKGHNAPFLRLHVLDFHAWLLGPWRWTYRLHGKLTQILGQILKNNGKWYERTGRHIDVFLVPAVPIFHRFIDFLHQYQGKVLEEADNNAFKQFMTEFWLQKTWAEVEGITAMPLALKLFYQFLKEKEFIKNDSPFKTMIDRNKVEFLNSYKASQIPD